MKVIYVINIRLVDQPKDRKWGFLVPNPSFLDPTWLAFNLKPFILKTFPTFLKFPLTDSFPSQSLKSLFITTNTSSSNLNTSPLLVLHLIQIGCHPESKILYKSSLTEANHGRSIVQESVSCLVI